MICSFRRKVSTQGCFFRGAVYLVLYKVGVTFESVDEIFKSDHSNESCYALSSSGKINAVQGSWVLSLSMKS